MHAVVFFHGHNSTAKGSMRGHRLRQQVVDSRQDVILIMPQGPYRSRDSSGGKLSKPKGLERLLREVRKTLSSPGHCKPLRRACWPNGRRITRVALAAHSGGFQVAADIVSGPDSKLGGHEISEVYIFDGLYGGLTPFTRWLKADRKKHKLMNFYGGGRPARNSHRLAKRLRKNKIRVYTETEEHRLTRRQLIKGRAVFVHTPVGHGGSTYKHNQLRDCLYASGFRRRMPTKWFKNKSLPRSIEERD